MVLTNRRGPELRDAVQTLDFLMKPTQRVSGKASAPMLGAEDERDFNQSVVNRCLEAPEHRASGITNQEVEPPLVCSRFTRVGNGALQSKLELCECRQAFFYVLIHGWMEQHCRKLVKV